jgi:hypothetical protein
MSNIMIFAKISYHTNKERFFMMKFTSTIFPLMLIFAGSTLAMEKNPPVTPLPTPAITTNAQPAALKTAWFGIPINVQTNFVSNEDVQKGMKIAEEFNETARSAIDKTNLITDSLISVGNGVAEAGRGINEVGKGFQRVAESVEAASTNVKLAMDNTSMTIDKGINNLTVNLKEASTDFVKATDKLSNEMDTLKKAGMRVAPETFAELNKLMKTCLTASIGGAIAVAGIVLFFKTFMSKESNENIQEDTRPLYKRILTNRYLISALLMAAGTGIILKSDKIVETLS